MESDNNDHYIVYKALGFSNQEGYKIEERLIECKRLLKETGSIFVHCDRNASHYLKIVMDKVMGGPKRGVPLSDVWEIPYLNPKARERVGWKHL